MCRIEKALPFDLRSFRMAEEEYLYAREKFLRLVKEFKLIQKERNKKEKTFLQGNKNQEIQNNCQCQKY